MHEEVNCVKDHGNCTGRKLSEYMFLDHQISYLFEKEVVGQVI